MMRFWQIACWWCRVLSDSIKGVDGTLETDASTTPEAEGSPDSELEELNDKSVDSDLDE